MKKVLTIFCLLMLSVAVAQNVPGSNLTPEVVKNKFKQEYPDAKLKRWEVKGGLKKDYVAVFNQGGYAKRARYDMNGVPVLLHTFHNKTQVPASWSAQVIAAYPGFNVDWANEWKNFKNGNHFIEIRLSKPGLVLKAWVKPDGSIINNDNPNKEMKENGEGDNDGSGQ
ncbi:MAG: hypothetical protein IT233_04160 [Bacteroidia bacterium]|nr:hypothetical protein [Bacteroidia bacterium]